MADLSYPRQRAQTRGFTCGAPRLFTIAPSGDRIVFVRSRSGADPAGLLWSRNVPTGAESVVVDPSALHPGAEDLSAAERARRERMREVGNGVVGYAVDDAVERAVVALSGGLYAADLVGGGPVRGLDVVGPVLDPRLSPDGRYVAYVAGASLRVCAWDGTGDRAVATPAHALETCGIVDFIAAEEFHRQRGFWWAPGSDALLVETVDTTAVREWWIADPVHPDQAPRPHRYPAAGTDNARLSLAVVRLDGARVDVPWDRDTFEYLVDVSWTAHGDPLLVVMSRDQKRQAVLAVDVATGRTTALAEIADAAWVDAAPGVTRWSPDGRLLTQRPDRATDTFRLHLGDNWLTPAGAQVRAVLDADDHGVLVAFTTDPLTMSVARAGWDGSWTVVADGTAPRGVLTARAGGGTTLVVSRTLDSTATSYEVRTGDGYTAEIPSHAQTLVVTPRPTMLEAGPQGVRTAVFFPTGHVPGSRRLPVVLSPYGGPGHQEVVAAGLAYGEDQWLADQGFCVVVADGRGTPGRGPSWSHAVLGDLATAPLDDQVIALHAVAARWPGDVDLERVAIRGWSFGGYLAALAVLRRPDVFHAAVAGAPVTDWRLYDTGYTERYLGHPADAPSAYEHSGLLADAANLSRPLLVIHGMTDDNVVVAHTLALSAALTVHGRPHVVLPLSGVTHMTPQEDVAENRLLLELDFLRRALDVG